MSLIVEKLENMNDIVKEGITFTLSGYESITGEWSMEFHAFDELDFLPYTDQFDYQVNSATFMQDIENNINRFIEKYNKFKDTR